MPVKTLPESLRDQAKAYIDKESPFYNSYTTKLLEEAAGEIERLNKRLNNCPFCGAAHTYATDIHCNKCDRWFDDDAYSEHTAWETGIPENKEE